MSVDNNKMIVRRFFDLYHAKNDDEAEKLFDPRAVIHQPGMGDLDVRAYRKLGEEYRSAFPDGKFILDYLIGEGDKVVLRCTYRGTQRGPIQGIPASGRLLVSPGISIFRFSQEGKIVEVWNETDQLDTLVQLGAVKAPQSMAH
jgi:steroid delta-isomerase-like uncharacterized protein